MKNFSIKWIPAMGLLVLCLSGWAQETEPDACTIIEKDYNSGGFSEDDFLLVDNSVIVDDDVGLNTDQELNLDELVLGLDQPFYVDYLSEGAGASHLFGFFFFDIDTDKDGVPDFFETGDNDDLDGDGILNIDDDDDDNDGILDTDDTQPTGVTSMPAAHFRLGATAAANGLTAGDYWQFVPNSTIAGGDYDGYYEHPGAFLYIDNNANEIPDVLEFNTGINVVPPFVVDKGYQTTDVNGDSFEGLLGNWEYQGTTGSTVGDKSHWLGSTIFYIGDDDGGTGQTSHYLNYTPYGTTYSDVSGSTDGHPDYNVYGTTDIEDPRIPELLKNGNVAKQDTRGEELWRYRWYRSNISGAREMIFFLVVFWNSGSSNVNTYYSKSSYNKDNPPTNPTRNGSTTGDAFGGWASQTNWYPEYRNEGEHDALVQAVFGVDKWSDIATIPTDVTLPPTLLANPASTEVTQAWIDEWENWNSNRRIIQYRALADWFSETAVDADTIVDGRYGIDMSAENDSSIIRAINGRMSHLMVGAPQDTKDAWLLGWEDLFQGGDRDFEDIVFYVKREAGGQIQSLNAAQSLSDQFEDFSLSQITFTFTDNMIDSLWGTEGRYVNYYYRLGSADDWIPLLGGEHDRTPDLFQSASGGETTEASGMVTRTITIQVQNKKQEIYWKAEIATDNVDTFQPLIHDVDVNFQSLVHDFYFNSAIIPSSNINYIGSHETPEITWDESKNRGHLYALKTFEHGNPPTNVAVGDSNSPELTPTAQPAQPFQWDAGVTLKTSLDANEDRTIYTYIPNNPNGVLSDTLTLKTLSKDDYDTDIVTALELSDSINGNVWTDNYHDPDADERDPNSASLWLANWIHGYSNPLVTAGAVVDRGPAREWVLGGINRASPLVLRAPGIPSWLLGTGVPIATKREYLLFTDDPSQRDMQTRILIGTESGLVHCLNTGQWIGKAATGPAPDEEEFEYADGHYDGFGDGSEVWAMLPGHLLDDIKYNYTGADSITANVDATAVSTIMKGRSGWMRIAVFSQGFKGGSQAIGGTDLTGNVVWALDLTDTDNPVPMWQRAEASAQDQINPPAIGWAEFGSDSIEWVVAYSSGGTPVSGQEPKFYLVKAEDGSLIREVSVATSGGTGDDLMTGTPALIDTDNNGYVDHLFGATSRGKLFAYDLTSGTLATESVTGARFFLAPNIQESGDGKVTVVAVSGDDPLRYDEDEYGDTDFENSVLIYEFDPAASSGQWVLQGTVDLPVRHKAFSRPKIIGNQLVVGTTTGDTFNFCDFDSDDPGSLLLLNINSFSIENSIDQFGSVLAPIIVSDSRVFAHRNTSSKNDPNESGSVFRIPADQVIQSEDVKQTVIAQVFGIIGMQDDLLKKIER